MLALALLLSAASPWQADADPSAADTVAVLAAFKEVCWVGLDIEKTAIVASARGWTPLKAGEQAVADRLRASIEGAAKPNYGVRVRQFSRKVQDRALLLTIQRGELTSPAAESFGSTHCSIRELSEPMPLDLLAAEKWMGRAPNVFSQNQDGSLFLGWHGLDPGTPTLVDVGYIPPKSDLVAPDSPPGIYLSTLSYGPYGAKPN